MWQSIDTAPKDGTLFVGWWRAEGMDCDFEKHQTHVVWWDARLSKWEYYTGSTLLTAKPTKWMALPTFETENDNV